MPSLNLNLNKKAWDILTRLSKTTGKSKAEILRNALMLVNLAEKEKKKKHTLAFIDEESDKLMAKIVNVL